MALTNREIGNGFAETASLDNTTRCGRSRSRWWWRRLILPAFSAAAFSASGATAQENNPFAEWDRLQQQTTSQLEKGTAEPAAPISPPSIKKPEKVEYFSAGGVTATLPTVESTEPPVLRERMTTTAAGSERIPPVQAVARSRANKAAAAATSQQSTVPAGSQAGWPSSFQIHTSEADSPGPSAAPVPEPALPPVQNAVIPAISSGSDAFAEPAIQQVSGTSPAETDTALDAFLKQYGTPPAAETAPAAAANVTLPPNQFSETNFPSRDTVSPDMSRGIAVDIPSATQGPQSPGVTLQWIHRGDLNVGEECPIELIVHNTSQTLVRSVYVEAVIPDNLQVMSMHPEPNSGSSAPGWTLGQMQPDERRVVKMVAVPKQRGDVRLDAFVRLTGYSSSSFEVQEPMIGVAVSGPQAGAVGQQLNYTITVANPGTGIASNVIVQAALPEGLEHRHGSLITMEVGTLKPGEQQEVLLSLNAVRGGEQPLAVRVLAAGGLSERNGTTVVVAEPELDLLIDGPTESITGRVNDFDLVVVNRGRVDSANVRARYRVPEGYEFVAADRGGRFNEQDRTVEFFVGTLQPGGSSKFQLTLKANETGQQLHQAGVISEHGQVTMAQRQTKVDGTAELKLNISSSREQVTTGQETVFEIKIENTGTRAASKVGLSCEMPPGLELVQASGPSEYIAENGVMVFRSVPKIDVGETIVIAIRARAKRDGVHSVRLRVASSSISEPLIGEKVCHVVR
jgi:uncharacterized repeat protein (TIGR01451 family)